MPQKVLLLDNATIINHLIEVEYHCFNLGNMSYFSPVQIQLSNLNVAQWLGLDLFIMFQSGQCRTMSSLLNINIVSAWLILHFTLANAIQCFSGQCHVQEVFLLANATWSTWLKIIILSSAYFSLVNTNSLYRSQCCTIIKSESRRIMFESGQRHTEF